MQTRDDLDQLLGLWAGVETQPDFEARVLEQVRCGGFVLRRLPGYRGNTVPWFERSGWAIAASLIAALMLGLGLGRLGTTPAANAASGGHYAFAGPATIAGSYAGSVKDGWRGEYR